MSDWDYLTDLLVVGSGGGLAAAVTAANGGFDSLVIEKEDAIGGSTGMSGGVMWLPNNPLMADEGVADTLELGLEYFDSVVGPPTPASSQGSSRPRRGGFASSRRNWRSPGGSMRCSSSRTCPQKPLPGDRVSDRAGHQRAAGVRRVGCVAVRLLRVEGPC